MSFEFIIPDIVDPTKVDGSPYPRNIDPLSDTARDKKVKETKGEPITDFGVADKLKEKLIEAGLCDSGATGGIARWMRLPVAINGRPKYGDPSPKCRLVQWRPELKYSVADLYSAFRLHQHKALPSHNSATQALNGPIAKNQSSDDAASVIVALQTKGLYKKALGSGKHDITCPWVNGHTDAADNGTAYFEPDPKYPTGGFKCHHSHGDLFHIRELKEFLGVGTETVEVTEHGHPKNLRLYDRKKAILACGQKEELKGFEFHHD